MMENNEKYYSVYMHICPNKKVYIGITSKECEERWKNGRGYANNRHFISAVEKYGWENIQHIIIKKGINKKEACELEKEYIKKFDATNRIYGYNISTGGECSSEGMHHTEEAKKKIGIASSARERKKESIELTAKARRKAVNVYDFQLKFIKKCKSIREAEELTGVCNSNISGVCKGKYKQCNGYVFRYADDEREIVKGTHRRPVEMYSLGGEYIKTFATIKEAAAEVGVVETHIGDCCRGKYSQSGGYIWKYA